MVEMHPLHALNDGPLAYALSRMGKMKSDKQQQRKERITYRTQVGGKIRVTKKSQDGKRRTVRRRRSRNDDGFLNMDLLRGVYTLAQVNHVTIDSLIFRLHSNATVILLVTFSIAVTTRQYVGNPIDCVHNREIPEEVFNTYCWIHSTFTIPGLPNAPSLYHDVQTTGDKSSKKQVKYYQWVAFILFFQI